MKIGLVAEWIEDGQVERNLQRMLTRLESVKGQGYDLICFGESYLQGFEGLTWDYEKDRQIAMSLSSEPIQCLIAKARDCQTGIGFGYIEASKSTLYSSFMIISAEGKILENFRRMSTEWKEPIVASDHRYAEGQRFGSFKLAGITIATAICGDLWHDSLLEQLQNLTSDVVLWPLYVDYSPESWVSTHRQEYAERVKVLGRPVLMINSYSPIPERAKGGCSIFKNGFVNQELPMGQPGMVTVEL